MGKQPRRSRSHDGKSRKNKPNKSIRIKVGVLIRKVHARHGAKVVHVLEIPQRQGTGQVGHGHGIETLHDEGRIGPNGPKGREERREEEGSQREREREGGRRRGGRGRGMSADGFLTGTPSRQRKREGEGKKRRKEKREKEEKKGIGEEKKKGTGVEEGR